MEKKAKALGMASEHYPDVSFAIGCGFEEDCRKVRRALVQADERMYEARKDIMRGEPYMKLKPILPEYELSEPEKDFENAPRIERWRVGQKAFYQPAGFGKYFYLPLTSILSAYPHDFRIKGGCSCAGTIPSGGVVITYGEKGVIKIVPGNEKNAARILEALKERIPNLDMTVPEIYRGLTRDPM